MQGKTYCFVDVEMVSCKSTKLSMVKNKLWH